MGKLKTLAIDYGTVRVGIAISIDSFADPLVILQNDENLIQNILSLCKENEVKHVVIGLSENEMAKKTKKFALELEKHINLPIAFVDETLSSHSVHNKLKGLKKAKRSGNIDHYAAAEFLQNWLDEN